MRPSGLSPAQSEAFQRGSNVQCLKVREEASDLCAVGRLAKRQGAEAFTMLAMSPPARRRSPHDDQLISLAEAAMGVFHAVARAHTEDTRTLDNIARTIAVRIDVFARRAPGGLRSAAPRVTS